MAQNITAVVKLQIPAGNATPAPPVGPALAPHGLQLQEFCQQFNEKTQDLKGFVVPVEITIYEDRSFSFITKQPPAADLIKKKINLEKGSGTPNRKKVGKITRQQLREIAEQKLPDMNTNDLGKAVATLEGTAKNMGLTVEE